MCLHGSSGDHTEIYVQDLASKGPLVTIVKDVMQVSTGRLPATTCMSAPTGMRLSGV